MTIPVVMADISHITDTTTAGNNVLIVLVQTIIVKVVNVLTTLHRIVITTTANVYNVLALTLMTKVVNNVPIVLVPILTVKVGIREVNVVLASVLRMVNNVRQDLALHMVMLSVHNALVIIAMVKVVNNVLIVLAPTLIKKVVIKENAVHVSNQVWDAHLVHVQAITIRTQNIA